MLPFYSEKDLSCPCCVVSLCFTQTLETRTLLAVCVALCVNSDVTTRKRTDLTSDKETLPLLRSGLLQEAGRVQALRLQTQDLISVVEFCEILSVDSSCVFVKHLMCQ